MRAPSPKMAWEQDLTRDGRCFVCLQTIPEGTIGQYGEFDLLICLGECTRKADAERRDYSKSAQGRLYTESEFLPRLRILRPRTLPAIMAECDK